MKQILVFVALAWIVFFLVVGGLAIVYGQGSVPHPGSINWVAGSGLYIIHTDSVDSMRAAFKDLQQYVLPKGAYTLKLKAVLDKACRRIISPQSSFIGHIIDPEGSTKALCITAMPVPEPQARLICFGLNLRWVFSHPMDREFACKVPGPPKVMT